MLKIILVIVTILGILSSEYESDFMNMIYFFLAVTLTVLERNWFLSLPFFFFKTVNLIVFHVLFYDFWQMYTIM